MKSLNLLLCCLLGGILQVNAQQTNAAPVKPASFGFGIAFFDFTTASRIRQSSLSAVINNKQAAKVEDFAPGANFTYSKGLLPKVDFAATLSFASGSVILQNSPERIRKGGMVAADASIQLKLLTDEYAVVPYVSGGLGATVFKGFYGAMMPLGTGIRFRITNDASINLQTQYRLAITETAGYHFMHGLTFEAKL